jgi:hypothetical protein
LNLPEETHVDAEVDVANRLSQHAFELFLELIAIQERRGGGGKKGSREDVELPQVQLVVLGFELDVHG